MNDKLSVFGLNFSAAPQESLRKEIMALAEKNESASVLFANAHVVVECSRDPKLRELLARATYAVPDGTPIAWVLKAKGETQTQRYSGPDFMVDVFREAPQMRHFFLGSTPETLDAIKKRFKGTAAGYYSPPFVKGGFSAEETRTQLRMIEDAKADFIWVGLGAPKQEKYVVEMAAQARRGVWLAVGAAFDFFAEQKPRAPKALQRLGLEWAFRWASEPRRLTGRYLSTNPAFIKLAVGELLGAKNPPN